MNVVCKKIHIHILMVILLLTTSITAKAQVNMAFYPLEDQFNSASYNPAFLTSESRFTFSIFPLAGDNIGYNDQQVISQLFSKLLKGINTDADYLDILKKMVRQSSFNLKMESDLLTFTYHSPKGFFNFRIRENISFSASVKGPVSEFMILPEVPGVVVGQVQHIPLLILHYREYSIGYSSPSRHQPFSWGLRAKLYFGKSVFSSGISGSIENTGGNHFFNTWGEGKMSMPEKQIINNNGTVTVVPNLTSSNFKDYLLNSGNPGIGFDLGFKYKISPKLSCSASILDLGEIKWKDKKNLTTKDFTSQSLLEESSITSKVENGVETVTKNADSISFENKFTQLFKIKESQLPFTTALPVTIYGSLNYQLSPVVKLNLVDRFIKIKAMSQNSLLASANFNLNNGVTVSSGVSMIGNAYFNIPLAVLLKRNFGQIYLGTDNLTALVRPTNSGFAGLTFGACFYILRKKPKYESVKYFPFFKKRKSQRTRHNGLQLYFTPE